LFSHKLLDIKEGIFGVTLNLHCFLQKMMDLEVEYLQSLLLCQYQYIVLHHHSIHMLNQLINMGVWSCAILIAVAALLEVLSVETKRSIKWKSICYWIL
jgi:hypothetical protein